MPNHDPVRDLLLLVPLLLSAADGDSEEKRKL